MIQPVPPSLDHSRNAVIGIVLKLISVFCLASMAASVKYLGPEVPPGQVIFFRGLIALVVIGVFAARTEGLGVLKTQNWRAHARRSLAGAASMFCWFVSLTMIPLAQMTAITFTIPLFLTILAVVFLREVIHWYRWSAIGIGLVGVLITVGPDMLQGGGSALGVGIALLGAVLAAFALMFLRRMSGEEHALTITFYFFLTSTTLALASTVFGGWPMPTADQWLLLGLVGIFGVLGQLTMTYSFRYAEASLIAPLDYVTMLYALAVGYFVFGEIPNVSVWIGAPLVIAAGGIILWRETRVLRESRRRDPEKSQAGLA